MRNLPGSQYRLRIARPGLPPPALGRRRPGSPPGQRRVGADPAFLIAVLTITGVAAVGWGATLSQLGLGTAASGPLWPALFGAGSAGPSSPRGVVQLPTPPPSPTATGTATAEPTPTPSPTEEPTATAEPTPSASPEPSATASPTASPTTTPVPPTSTPRPPAPTLTPTPLPLVTHVVDSGDTLSSIAARYDADLQRITGANRLPGELLLVGQTLYIPRVSGVVHRVGPGDTLAAIARLYGVAVDALVEANGLQDPGLLIAGDLLIVPGPVPPLPSATATVRPLRPGRPQPATPTAVPQATRAPPARIPAPPRAESSPGGPGSSVLLWPSRGPISQGFGEDGHTGIDIMADAGDSVVAAAPGVVTAVVRSAFGYGWRIEVDHGSGLSTLYAHLGAFSAQVGDRVSGGQRLGSVGSTGESTGPHLHFEVRQGGLPTNPLSYLR